MMGRFNFSATTCCVVVLSLFAQSTWATPLLDTSYPELPLPLLARQAGPIVPGGKPCGQNNATNRGCWKNQWNVSTDYEFFHPPAFSNRVYNLHITNVTNWMGPDGVVKHAMLINNQFPGPTIEADWGDYVTVNVYNDMQDNGTSIHWHGIRQFGESNNDGANGVTECPIPPGHMKTYAFHVTQYGTSWYHSHYSNQYGNGVVGSLVVRGPASANYDIDLGPYHMTDYYHETADRLTLRSELVANGAPPDSDNIMFRGKAVHPTAGTGQHDRLTLTPGKKHLLRLINASVDNSFTVSLVGHNFTVVATDLVPVTPTVRQRLFMGVGQRYDVIIDATAATGHYWLNATLEASNQCGKTLNPFPAAIVSYTGATPANGLPTDRGVVVPATCVGEDGFVPIVKRTLSASQFVPKPALNVTLAFPTHDPARGAVFEWRVRGTPINVEWDHPVLEYVLEGNDTFPGKVNLVEVPEAEQWVFWVVQNDFGLPHPIHLHGHDMMVLGIGGGQFDVGRDVGKLKFDNPVRRDVVQVPGTSWLVIAYKTDNPGCWLMHCHIGWHVAAGLGIQFLERKTEIRQLMKLEQMKPNCDAWRAYEPTSPYLPKTDSGLRRRGGPSLNPGSARGMMHMGDGKPAVRRLW